MKNKKRNYVMIANVLCLSVALHALPPSPQTIMKATQRAATAARSTPAQRMLEQMVRDTSFRSGISTSLPYQPVIFPLQEPRATLSLDEIKRQITFQAYTPQLFSSWVHHINQSPYQKLLYQNFLSLSLQGMQPAPADKKLLLNYLRTEAQRLLTEVKKGPVQQGSGQPDDAPLYRMEAQVEQEELPEADAATRSVLSYIKTPQQRAALQQLGFCLTSMGLYGEEEEVKFLQQIYAQEQHSVLEPVVMAWVVRSLFALGANQEAHSLLKQTPSSNFKKQFELFEQRRFPALQNRLQVDPSFAAWKPMVQKTDPSGVVLFDFSALATDTFMEWRNMLQGKESTAKMPDIQAAVAKPASRTERLFNRKYPSGLTRTDEERLVRDWLDYYKHGYFKPRNQIEVIEGMSAAKANNVMEYIYYMTMEEAEELILKPLRETGRLPEFMYTAGLIPNTERLPHGYYKNKFNKNIARFVELADEDGTIYTHNVELKDLVIGMRDYTFEQGFSYRNHPELTKGLRRNWEEMVTQIEKKGLRADRNYINKLWHKPVQYHDGQKVINVSLRDYFTQVRHSAVYEEDVAPSFYLNSPKWVAWENERRSLRATEKIVSNPQDEKFINRWQRKRALKHPEDYMTLEQFANVMRTAFLSRYGNAPRVILEKGLEMSPAEMNIRDIPPSTNTVKVNNFEKIGGVCQMSFGDGGYAGPVEAGYDGTSTVPRFESHVFDQVEVVVFDMENLTPIVVTLDKVSYLKDLKKPDVDRERASTMMSDGLDLSRDLLTVEQEEKALANVPNLRATIYPVRRISHPEKVPYMHGGGLAGYLALFTPDFYPLKKVKLLREVNGKKQWVTQYYVHKAVPFLAGTIHRENLTLAPQVQDRIYVPPQEKQK